jgi:hypothetical protein
MLDGSSVVAALRECGATHVVWIPDSDLGTWEKAILSEPGLTLVRVCREGEAITVAAGLHLGGKRPVVMMQCTGFFEAGDAFRNIAHDLKIPLLVIVGIRSWMAAQSGKSLDSCPIYAQPIVAAWNVSHVLCPREQFAATLVSEYRTVQASGRARVLLLPE